MNGLLFFLMGTFIYLIPCFVADLRKHENATAIAALNVLLGWTVLGWVAALVWALTNQQRQR